jgi:glycosyltransferase involved in cell wall biosynthesis
MKPMCVLLSIPKLDKGGGVAAYFRAINSKLSVEIHYLLRGSRSHQNQPITTMVRILKDYGIFWQQLTKNTYELVHVNTSLGLAGLLRDSIFILIAKKIYGRKVLVFFHGWDWNFALWINGPLQRVFLKTFGQADRTIVLATQFMHQLQAWGYARPIHVETTAVDDELFDQFDSEKHAGKFKGRQNNVQLLFLARVEKTKGVYEVIDMFRILKQRHSDLNLTIAGSGTELTALKEYAARHNISDVRFTGFVSGMEKAREFNQADIYIFPSYYEGLPISVLEAMSFALPIVTRPIGGLKDIFEDGKMGFMTESLEPQVLSALVDRLIENDDLRYKMGVYNREYARQRFIGSQVARRLENIYLQTIAGSPLNPEHE